MHTSPDRIAAELARIRTQQRKLGITLFVGLFVTLLMAFVSTSVCGAAALVWLILFTYVELQIIPCPRCGGRFQSERATLYSLRSTRDDWLYPEQCRDCGLNLYDDIMKVGRPSPPTDDGNRR